MKTATIYQDDQRINDFLSDIETSRQQWQTLYDINKTLGLIKIKTTEDLGSLAAGGEGFLKQKLETELPQQSLSFGIFKLKRSAAVDLLDLPDFSELNAAASACQSAQSLSYLKLSGDTIIVNQAAIDEYVALFTLSATTKRQIELYEAHKQCSEALAKVRDLVAPFLHVDGDTKLSTLFDHDLKLKDYFYQQFRNEFKKL